MGMVGMVCVGLTGEGGGEASRVGARSVVVVSLPSIKHITSDIAILIALTLLFFILSQNSSRLRGTTDTCVELELTLRHATSPLSYASSIISI